MFLDDLLFEAYTVDEALKISKGSFDIFEQTNFSLRKWYSKSAILKYHLKSLNMNVRPNTSTDIIPFRILGLMWYMEEDIFSLDNQNFLEFVLCPK